MAIHKTEGMILSSADWSESSQTMTIFTPDRGKLTLTLRGSRRLDTKRGRPLRFARLEVTYYLREGGESGYISDVEPVEAFLFEKDGQLGRLTFAAGAIELLDNLLTAQDPQPACYQITLSFLRMVDQVEKKRLPGLFAGYILRLISLLGFRPNLTGCVGCGKETAATTETEASGPSTVLLSIERGGVVCDECRTSMPGYNQLVALPVSVHRQMIRLMESSLEEASRRQVSLADLIRIMELITAHLKYHAGTIRQLKSFDFLDKLARAVKHYGG
jgi:DNA repair protein RecO (recombination protein O)